MLTIDINTGEILHKRNIPEGQHVIALKDYALFYTIYRNKTFLYNIKTKNYVELKNFFKNFGIIPKILKKEDKLIVFYSSSETSSTITHKNGVYIYDLSNGYGYQYCNLDNKISAYGHNFLDIIDFSFNAPLNTDKTIFCDTHNYWNYLRFVFEQFGIYAMLYRLDKEKADKEIFDNQEIPQDKRSGLLNIVNYFSTKMMYFPTTDCEFKSLTEDLEVASGFLKEIFTDN